MARAPNGRERERPGVLRDADGFTFNLPGAPSVLSVCKTLLSRPLQFLNPQLVRDPVALPIVGARIDKQTNSAF